MQAPRQARHRDVATSRRRASSRKSSFAMRRSTTGRQLFSRRAGACADARGGLRDARGGCARRTRARRMRCIRTLFSSDFRTMRNARRPPRWHPTHCVARARIVFAPARGRDRDEFFRNDVLTLKKTVIRFRRKQTPAKTSEQSQRDHRHRKTDIRPSDQDGGCRHRSLWRNATRSTHAPRRATYVPGFLCPPRWCTCIARAVGSVAPGPVPVAGWPSRAARGHCYALGYTPIDTDEEPLTWP